MSDLRGNIAPSKVNFGASGKIFSVVVVALGVCALTGYAYSIGQFNMPHKTHSVVSDNELPTTSAPGQ